MSSAEKKHDYHLVDPSPWPIFCSFASLIVCIGAVYYFTTKNLWLMFIGLAVLFYGAFMWFREVVIEAEHKGDHTPVVQISHRYGMVLFIASEVMFFVAWFWAYFDASLFPDQAIGGVWPPNDIQTLENDRKSLIQGLTLTVILGAIFTMFQAYEYMAASFTMSSGIYGSTFYMATGFHGFHVLIGTIFLAVCLFRAKRGHYTPEHHFGFEAAAWYWHFVDVVWLFLFAAIYIWGS